MAQISLHIEDDVMSRPKESAAQMEAAGVTE